MRTSSNYALRLPASLKRAVEEVARQDGTTLNQFIVSAVAEKLTVLKTADYFAKRAARADFRAFDRLLRRRGGSSCPVTRCQRITTNGNPRDAERIALTPNEPHRSWAQMSPHPQLVYPVSRGLNLFSLTARRTLRSSYVLITFRPLARTIIDEALALGRDGMALFLLFR
jgi:hypothetical protein